MTISEPSDSNGTLKDMVRVRRGAQTGDGESAAVKAGSQGVHHSSTGDVQVELRRGSAAACLRPVCMPLALLCRRVTRRGVCRRHSDIRLEIPSGEWD